MKFHGVHWTEPLEARLWELATSPEQPTYDEIAHILATEFGVRLTKNSCIGRARRMGVPVRITPRFRSNGDAVVFKVDPRKARPAPRRQLPAEPRYDHVSLYELRDKDCHWPHGNEPPFEFCGRPTYNGCSYCEEHAKRSYPPMRKT